jgi:hypothetical protein
MAASRVAGGTVQVRMNVIRPLLSNGTPCQGRTARLRTLAPPGSLLPVRQMLLHFKLGIAVLVADPLDVEEFL